MIEDVSPTTSPVLNRHGHFEQHHHAFFPSSLDAVFAPTPSSPFALTKASNKRPLSSCLDRIAHDHDQMGDEWYGADDNYHHGCTSKKSRTEGAEDNWQLRDLSGQELTQERYAERAQDTIMPASSAAVTSRLPTMEGADGQQRVVEEAPDVNQGNHELRRQLPTPTWRSALPLPVNRAGLIPRGRVLSILSLKIASLLLIDVRGPTNSVDGLIRGCLNIPAETFFWNRAMLYELAYKAGMEWVVFVGEGQHSPGHDNDAERGRDSDEDLCAGWYLDWVRNTAGDDQMQVLVLDGGVSAWKGAGRQYENMMDGGRRESTVEEARNADGMDM